MYTAMRGFRQAYKGWCAEQKHMLRLRVRNRNCSRPSANMYPKSLALSRRFCGAPRPTTDWSILTDRIRSIPDEGSHFGGELGPSKHVSDRGAALAP